MDEIKEKNNEEIKNGVRGESAVAKTKSAGGTRSKRTAEKDKNMTFETAMTRLEAVVRALEDGKTPLEESMKLYEEGISLVRFCSGKLDAADKKVRILTGEDTIER